LDAWINGASSRCCPGTISLQKKFAGCCEEAKVGHQYSNPSIHYPISSVVAVPSAALGAAGL
jgi:hypothetical protein